jgi:hypothetical protein
MADCWRSKGTRDSGGVLLVISREVGRSVDGPEFSRAVVAGRFSEPRPFAFLSLMVEEFLPSGGAPFRPFAAGAFRLTSGRGSRFSPGALVRAGGAVVSRVAEVFLSTAGILLALANRSLVKGR